MASGVVTIMLLFFCAALSYRMWKRNRYYKMVQHSLDEEERAFQDTLARSYNEDARLDGSDQEKLRMLESYLASARSREAAELEVASEAPIPTRVEDVDRFMAELAAAAGRDTRQHTHQMVTNTTPHEASTTSFSAVIRASADIV